MTTSQTHPHPKLRVPQLIAGVVTGVIALSLLVVGGGLLWADGQRDRDGYLSTDRHALGTDRAALVSGNLDLNIDGAEWLVDSEDLDEARVSVKPEGSKPVFAGIARTSDVERYLSRTAHTVLENVEYREFGPFDDFDAGYRHVAGPRERAGRPADETFWVESVSGSGAQDLTWDVRDGNWTIVVMNADGSRGVHADISAGARLPVLDVLGWTAVGGGVIFLMLTTLLVMSGVRPRHPAPRVSAPAVAA